MEEEKKIKYTHARIVPTIIVLIVSFLLFGFVLGYNWGYAHGQVEQFVPAKKYPDILIVPPAPLQKKAPLVAPVDSSGYINI